MTVPKKPLAGFLTVGLMLLAASPGQANHVAGATYTGTYDGGTVDFDVSDDGTAVTHFGVTMKDGRPCADITITPAMPINGHAFAGPFGPRLSVTGSFPGGRSAEGTFALRDVPSECPSGTVPWSATVDRTAPALRLGGRRSQSIQQRNVLVVADVPTSAVPPPRGARCACPALGRSSSGKPTARSWRATRRHWGFGSPAKLAERQSRRSVKARRSWPRSG